MIIAVTHGEKYPGSDPHITEKGREQMHALAARIANCTPFATVIVGTGARMEDSYKALRTRIDFGRATAVVHCPLVGSADTGERQGDGRLVMLTAGGERIDYEPHYLGLERIGGGGEFLWNILRNIQVATSPAMSILIICSREFILALGRKDPQSATLYELNASGEQVLELPAPGR